MTLCSVQKCFHLKMDEMKVCMSQVVAEFKGTTKLGVDYLLDSRFLKLLLAADTATH